MRGLTNFFRRLRVAIGEERRLVIGVPGLALAILGLVIGVSDERQVGLFGKDGPRLFAMVEIVLVGLLIALFVWFLARVGMRLRPLTDPVPALRQSAFHCRVISGGDEARHINVNLVHQVFPDAPTPPDQGLTAHDKNPRRLVGLVKTETGEIVGWASLWPVSARAGREIESGKRNDDDLVAADLLPVSRNGNTKYLVLRAFAVLREYRTEPENLALKLGSFALAHIIEEFIRSPDRSIRLLAIAYTKEGEKLCHALGLTPNGYFADYGRKLGKKPVYAADVTMKSLCRRLGDR